MNPFRYTPQQVLASSPNDSLPADLARLVELRERSPELAEILKRVHFGELPTIYPPVSQAVFAVCSWLTPADSSVSVRLLLMKSWFVVFDLITIGLVIRLLRQAQMSAAHVVTYAWCPLVVKEVANSGHLDSLAICFTALSISWALSALRVARPESSKGVGCSRHPHALPDGLGVPPSRRRSLAFAIAAAIALALGVGAKLCPVVLAPLLLLLFARRIGWRAGLAFATCFVALTAAILWPMHPSSEAAELRPTFDESSVTGVADGPPLPPREVSTAPRDPSESVQAFLCRWEMNDFLFLLVIENLRPSEGLPTEQRAWFAVTPESWRQALVQRVVSNFGIDVGRVPFFATRLLLSAVFVILASVLAWRASVCPMPHADLSSRLVLESAFLTLVWFWLLLPTQNPWYLLWSLPFLPFARSRAWWLLSGLAFVYYVRFWLIAQFPSPTAGTPYPGAQFFDFIVTWLEYAPWFAWLVCDLIVFRKRCNSTATKASRARRIV